LGAALVRPNDASVKSGAQFFNIFFFFHVDYMYYLPSTVNKTTRGQAYFDFPLGISPDYNSPNGGRSQFVRANMIKKFEPVRSFPLK
jgi:hypothetical protein